MHSKTIWQSHDPIVERFEGNPIITGSSLNFPTLNILNAGAARVGDEVVLLLRVEDMRGISVFLVARSRDGLHFVCEDEPLMQPSHDDRFAPYETRGVENPRITFLDGVYYIVYAGASEHGTCLMLAKTADFRSVDRIAVISEPDNRHGALFPQKFDGRYLRLERPREGGNVWLSSSPDLVHWGHGRVVLSPRGPGYWDSSRIGCGIPPIATEHGWLVLYAGIRDTSGGAIYSLGAALLDREQPDRLIGRTPIPILAPELLYERVGDVQNLIFSCGGLLEPDGELKIYYGASNTAICLAYAPVERIIAYCVNHAAMP